MRCRAYTADKPQSIWRRSGHGDFANLFMEAARSLSLAARVVSGYLNAPLPDGRSGSTHAWAEVYLPGAGWKSFDTTSGEIAGTSPCPLRVCRKSSRR